MRALVIAIVVVLVLALLGWLRFSTPDGKPTMQIDTQEMQEDSGEIVEQGKAAVENIHAEFQEESEEGVRRNSPNRDDELPAESVEQ